MYYETLSLLYFAMNLILYMIVYIYLLILASGHTWLAVALTSAFYIWFEEP